jgi:protein-disulfide isomerase
MAKKKQKPKSARDKQKLKAEGKKSKGNLGEKIPLEIGTKNVLAILFLVILIILLIYVFYPQSINEEKSVVNTESDQIEQINNLVNKNKSAINQAVDVTPEPVRGIDATDHKLGDILAPVQLIVYDDFTTPFSFDFNEALKLVQENYKNKVVIAFRHFPAYSNAFSMLTALASECAAEQGKFWEMHDKLLQANKNQELDSIILADIAADIDLKEIQFEKCYSEDSYQEKIFEQVEEAQKFSVTGAPTFFINGDIYIGAYPYEDFTRSNGEEAKGLKSIIEEYLNK